MPTRRLSPPAAFWSVAEEPVWPAWLLVSDWAMATPIAASRAADAAVAVSFFWKLRMLGSPVIEVNEEGRLHLVEVRRGVPWAHSPAMRVPAV